MRVRTIIFLAISAVLIAGAFLYWAREADSSDRLNVRLQWFPQAQFAGYIVADRLGYYAAEGLQVKLEPAGPELKPLSTLAAGSDDVGIGVSNQVALARANGVPIKIIAQLFQDSANRYVVLDKNRIQDLRDLRGKKVGLWLGGDEAEFVAMLSSVGMAPSDVQVIPQGESVTPFLNGDYAISEVTIYNELLVIEDQLGGREKLQIIAPSSYNAAIVGDDLMVTERTIATKRGQLIRFLRASIRGWRYAIQNQEAAVDLVLAANPELKRDQQLKQLEAVATLILTNTPADRIGQMKAEDYQRTLDILRRSGQLSRDVNPQDMFDASLLEQVIQENAP